MKEMCIIHRPYICKNCGDEMLFFVTGNPNYIIDYKNLFYKEQTCRNIYDVVARNNVSCIKCLACGKKFIIDWSNKFPEQLVDKESIQKFMGVER